MSTSDVRPWNGPLYSEDCDPRVQSKVQARLEAWYSLADRANAEPPLRSTYTGLADQFRDKGEHSDD